MYVFLLHIYKRPRLDNAYSNHKHKHKSLSEFGIDAQALKSPTPSQH